MLFAVGAVEAKIVCHQLAIKRQSRPGNRARSQRTNIQPLAAICQPVGIAQKHLDICQQPMRDQNRFGPLQVRVSRHRGVTRLFGAIHETPHKSASSCRN